jgi:hypothetical protein
VMGCLLIGVLGCGPKTPQYEDPTTIWPMEFYEKLNLRTFLNYYTPFTKAYCNTYPRDFFSREQVVMPDVQTVVMENVSIKLSIGVEPGGKVVMINERKDGTIWDKKLFDIYYDEEHDDYRVKDMYIQPKEKCFYLLPKEDENTTVD